MKWIKKEWIFGLAIIFSVLEKLLTYLVLREFPGRELNPFVNVLIAWNGLEVGILLTICMSIFGIIVFYRGKIWSLLVITGVANFLVFINNLWAWVLL